MEADFSGEKEVLETSSYAQMCAFVMSRWIQEESYETPDPSEPEDMAFTFLLESEIEEEKFPMSPALIQKEQAKDKELQRDISKNPDRYRKRKLEGSEIITQNKLICIPKTLQKRIVAWYHHYLAHPGMTRLEATL
jgi:hypothetical protein